MTQVPTPDEEDPPPGLGLMRSLGAAVLLFERVLPAIAPALGLLILLACVALLDLPRMLPPALHIAILVIAGVAVLALLWRSVRNIVTPRDAEIDRRLEADTGLRHQPLSVLSDRPAGEGGPLWKAHVARARAQIGRLRLNPPRPMLAAADPRAVRALVLVALAACLAIAGPDAGLRLANAFRPVTVPVAAPPAPVLQAWITPPAFTGLPPMFLKPETGALTVPEGSHLAISVTGGTDLPALVLDRTTTPFTALDANSFQIEQELTTGGHLAVRRDGRDLAAWDVGLIADVAPVVRFTEPPGVVRSGPTPMVRLPWQVTHAYGVASLHAELHLRDRPSSTALEVPIPLPGATPKSAKGARAQDMTAHPWAGLAVVAQLIARDSPGLEGRSETETFVLPERRFNNPEARALVAVRKQLSLHPEDRRSAVVELNRISQLPLVWDDDESGYVNLRAISELLRRNRDEPAVPDAQSRLWQLALHVEEGAAERTAKALTEARQAVRDALQTEKRGEKVDKADMDQRMRALQEAIQKRLDALTEQARRDPGSDRYDPEQHPLDKRDMQKLTDEMRDDARKGDMDQARDKMAELEQTLEALQKARPEHGQMSEREKQRAEKRQKGQQQMTALQDIVQREGALLDRSQSRAQNLDEAINPQRQNRPPGPPQDQPSMADHATDQKVQLALRRAVGELMQQYGDLTGEVPSNLGDADTAMREAAQAMGDARDGQAASAAQRAIAALQKGGQSMSQQMAQQFGPGQQPGDESDGQEGPGGEEDGDGQGGSGQALGGDQPGGMQPGEKPGTGPGRGRNGKSRSSRQSLDRDPLGRQRGEGMSGTDESSEVQVPDQMEEARTRVLQEELRRRGAERSRPQEELDYIDRLLKQF